MFMTARRHPLDLRIPPPLVAAACAGGAWWAARETPTLLMSLPAKLPVAVAIAAVGVLLAVVGVLTFLRARTTIHPLTPERSSALVTGGIYRWTRNPMYLGMAVVLLGWTWWIDHPAGFAGIAVFVGFITRFQIMPEERALAERFGTAFAEYRFSVRRWL